MADKDNSALLTPNPGERSSPLRQSQSAYISRGVSATKDDVRAAVSALDAGLFPGAFCKLLPDLHGDGRFCGLMHTDDVGTKSSLAYLVYRETGDASVFAGLAQDSLVMNLDDMLCVGACGPFIMSNTIGRNAHRVGGDAVKALIGGYVLLCEKLEKYGIRIEMAGGETSDTGDIVQTVFVDSTLYTRMKRTEVIDASNIRPGDVTVGLASFGQAVYENFHNAGMGSNGLTAARHLLLEHSYSGKYPESYSSTIDPADVYCGRFKLEDQLPGGPAGLTVARAILSPTRTYAPIIAEIIAAIGRADIHGIIHNTGGGLTKCENFGRGVRYVKDALFPTPPLFAAIEASGQIARAEMYRIFNMGHRLEVYCDEGHAAEIIKTAVKFGVEAKLVGHTEAASDSEGRNSVVIRDHGEEFVY